MVKRILVLATTCGLMLAIWIEPAAAIRNMH
jgi:hypothetical protein